MGSGASRDGVIYRSMVTTSVQTDPLLLGEVPGQVSGDSDQVIHAASAQILQTVPKKSPIEESWLAVCESLDVPEGQHSSTNLVVNKHGWKTVRIFVSSTFKDFQEERGVLVKEVFPDLRAWCESRRLHLVECDLRWGIPKDTTTELTLRTCLGEIDRCYQDNIMPYFLNMTSERIGWVPEPGEVPQNLVDEYRWVFGLSVTEMEIIHGAYRKDNPNSIFLIRDDSFLDSIPESHRHVFVDENPIAVAKLEKLRQKIRDRFPENRVISYKCQFSGLDSNSNANKVKLHFDDVFRDRVMSFFKDRISMQYPLFEGEEDEFQKIQDAHETFMNSRAELVLGRSNLLKEIASHVNSGGTDTPLILLGGPGTGKSSIMARAADEINTRAMSGDIPGAGSRKWHVFYHFVGAVPGSTDLGKMLIRLLRQIGVIDDSNMPTDLDSTVQQACSALNNPSTPPVILIIDALNQFDEDETAATVMTWVPRKLSPHVRCIFSMIQDTPQHKNLMSRESKPTEIIVQPLSLNIRKNMIAEFLGKFNKRLDMDQMILLLSKKSSENPLWLSIACEELRVSGEFRQLDTNIESMADGLLELLEQVLERFETEGGGSLLVSTLCLLEISATGLLESELLFILADEESLVMPQDNHGLEKGSKEKSEKENKKYSEKLPAYKWAGVYRSLRQFLRPFGNSGEGRLDFYHRSVSKAVRNKYLKNDSDDDTLSATYRWWHSKLADYFEQSDNYDRKVEEYPYHVIKLGDMNRLERALAEWPVFERLFDKEHSGKLVKYWQKCGGKEEVLQCYSEKLQDLTQQNVPDDVLCRKYEQVGRFLVQMGEYTFSEDLCVKALDIEKTKLGNRPERTVELYNLMANIWDQRSKLHEFCSADQVPELMDCVKYNKLAVDLLETMSGKYYQVMLGKQYIKMAFALASLTDCGGSSEINATQALDIGNDMIEKAITTLKQLGDNGHLAEAYMTQAVLCRNEKTKQLKLYNQALEMCIQAYGRYHPLCGRINFNCAICYEDARQYAKAYDLFKENYLINKEVYGVGHVKYQRSRDLFDEPIYKRMVQQRNDTDLT